MAQWGASTLSYDLNGNLTSDGVNTLTWDARNQLVSISGTTTGTFEYDGLGRRTHRTVGLAAKDYLYDGINPVQEDLGGGQKANLLTGLGVDERFVRTDPVWSQHFLPDGLGSTVALTDSAGTVATQYTYEPFGATTETGATSGNSFQYTGRENDGSGLYYYRARYYSPTFQRFISEDPLGFGGGINFYAYVSNNPMRWVDPLGLVDAVRGGRVLRAEWQIPSNHNAGLGYRVTIVAPDGTYDQYGHMDPNTTPDRGETVQAGDYIGEYATPTNGRSTGSHVHYERRDQQGRIIDPGNESPIPGGNRTSGFGDRDAAHPNGHQGTDWVNPPGNPGGSGDGKTSGRKQ